MHRSRGCVAIALTIAGVIAGCSTADRAQVAGSGGGTGTPIGSGTCSTGTEGCACSTPGAVVECGKETQHVGNYVTCSMGHARCENGAWSACAGDRIVTMSVPGLSLGAGGLHTASAAVNCTNVCDPYGCTSTSNGPGDVPLDAGLYATDGGLTLWPGDASGPSSTCNGLKCNVVTCDSGTTTITGTVFDPAGKNPLYNATVFIPIDPTGTLPALASGASCDQCGGSTTSIVATATTGVDGTFTLTNVPVGTNIPIVVQLGKWRREIVLTKVNACTVNVVTNNCTSSNAADCTLRLPTNQHDGYDPAAKTYTKADMPHIAIVTGSADPFECMLLKAGIDPNEFGSTTKNASRRIHVYESPDAPGTVLDPSYGDAVDGDQLWDSTANMGTYDAILFPCEGASIDKKPGAPTGVNPYQNLISYTDIGGRLFTTHYGYVWMEYPSSKSYVTGTDNWSGVAKWTHQTGTTNTQDPLVGTINTSFTKGQAFTQWMSNVGAESGANQVSIHEGRQDLTTIGTSTQQWMSATDTNNGNSNYTNLFTFNTPYAAAAASQCGRAIYSDFHVSALALAQSSQCLTDQDCGFTATCVGAKTSVGTCTEPCTSAADCHDSSYTCSGYVAGACQPLACDSKGRCKQGKCNTKTNTCGCTRDNQCGSGSCNTSTGVCDPQSCSTKGDCGSSESCSAGSIGQCKKACTSSASCGGGEICTGGYCTGCTSSANCFDNGYTAACQGGSVTYGTCSPYDANTDYFPQACLRGNLSAQEKALEFMFFDLTACVQPDSGGTVVVPPKYHTQTFTQDFTASCPSGTNVRWGEFDWQATIPAGTQIDFYAQTGADASSLVPTTSTTTPPPYPHVKTTTSTTLPNFDAWILDTDTGGTQTGTGAFNTWSPAIRSGALLRLTITMTPTADGSQTPTLISWKTQYDCVPTQ